MVGKRPTEFMHPVLRGQKKTFAEFLDAIPRVTLAIDPKGDVFFFSSPSPSMNRIARFTSCPDL